ncbi:MAG: SGNH/GDSL hydrolase family protein [Neomegalonema sp.]|nr:SGNH/GDSL hydrolase family protein [Neomegalonema sp.]
MPYLPQADAIIRSLSLQAGELESIDPSLSISGYFRPQVDWSDFSSFFGFGDSLVDSGIAGGIADLANDGLSDNIDSPTREALGYVENRFTNGPNYFDQIHAEITGLPVYEFPTTLNVIGELGESFSLPDYAEQGVNFAIGGSTARSSGGEDIAAAIDSPIRIVPDLANQIETFKLGLDGASFLDGPLQIIDDWFGVDSVLPTLSSSAMAGINFGGNDLFNFLDENPDLVITDQEIEAFTASYVDAYRSGIDELIDAGMRNFLIAGVPNVGLSPNTVFDYFGGDLRAAVDFVAPLVEQTNEALYSVLTEFSQQYPSVDFYFFAPDIAMVLDDPEAFGFDPDLLTTPFTDDFQDPTVEVTFADIGRYAFMDDFHPTLAGQELLFDQAAAAQHVGNDFDSFANGSLGSDTLLGTAGRDLLNGLAGDDILSGGDGGDVLGGGAGDDTLTGGAGTDLIVAGNGRDILKGGTGDDALVANGGNDILFGGLGDDTLAGGIGLDQLFGQAGDDVLDGGAGSDRLTGGAGADRFVFRAQATAQRDTVVDFDAQVDILDFSQFSESFTADTLSEVLANAQDLAAGALLDFGDGQRLLLAGYSASEIDEDWFVF